jgi:hypothetical protein
MASKFSIRPTFNIETIRAFNVDDVYYILSSKGQLINQTTREVLLNINVSAFTFAEVFDFPYCLVISNNLLLVFDASFTKPSITRVLPISNVKNICYLNSILYLQKDNIVYLYNFLENSLINKVEFSDMQPIHFAYTIGDNNYIISHCGTTIYFNHTMTLDVIKQIDLSNDINSDDKIFIEKIGIGRDNSIQVYVANYGMVYINIKLTSEGNFITVFNLVPL